MRLGDFGLAKMRGAGATGGAEAFIGTSMGRGTGMDMGVVGSRGHSCLETTMDVGTPSYMAPGTSASTSTSTSTSSDTSSDTGTLPMLVQKQFFIVLLRSSFRICCFCSVLFCFVSFWIGLAGSERMF